jgi:acyl-homoserine lactone acylase PvdQ
VLDNNTLQFNQQKIWQSYQYLQTKWAKPSRIDEITGSAANTSSCRNFDHRQIQQQKYISAFVSSLLSICKKKKKNTSSQSNTSFFLLTLCLLTVFLMRLFDL